MRICKFNEIESDLIKHISDRRLLPVLGSGFSVGSPSLNGKVPSGKNMKEYMVDTIKMTVKDKSDISDKSFSQIASYYHRLISKEERKKYIKDNFTQVELPDLKCSFLNINWLYVYSLNMDDAIENCSNYKTVVSSNRDVDFSNLPENSCVIKLHGDAKSFIIYNDDNSQVFDFKQYAQSIMTNTSLLNKLRDDFTYNNLLFIGCSLDNEFDLATIDIYENRDAKIKTSKYFFTVNTPDDLKQIDLEQYGITHIVVFENFDEMYLNMELTYKKSKEIKVENINKYRNLKITKLEAAYRENVSYLFYGKSLLDIKNNRIILPNFFIHRTLAREIVNNIGMNTIHILYGPRVSGKTYLLFSLIDVIRDKDIYFFDSRHTINKQIINKLLQNENSMFVFDNNTLSTELIFEVLSRQEEVNKKNNNIIISVNTSDKLIISILNDKKHKLIKGYPVKSKFDMDEIKEINKYMPRNELPNFEANRTMIDNIIRMEKNLEIKKRFSKIKPYTRDKIDIIILLLFAIKEKLYTSDLSFYDIDRECYAQISKTEPLITEEYTVYFERTIENTSEKKFVLNAKYWLYESLGDFAKKKENYNIIVDAYRYIVSLIIRANRRKSYLMNFVKFDVINEIFQTKYKGQVGLAKAIYEGLSDLLSDDPQYFHQRAKCLLWQSDYHENSLEQLKDALRFANTAKHNFEIEYENKKNEKVAISLAHTIFTCALIKSRICIIQVFKDSEFVSDTISSIHEAIINPYNTNEIYEKRRKEKQHGKDDLENILKFCLSEKLPQVDVRKVSETYNIYRYFSK